MGYYAGKNGSVTVQRREDATGDSGAEGAVTARPLTQWALQTKSEAVDVTNFTSGGYQESVAGILGGTIRASGPSDGAGVVGPGDKVSFVLNFGTTGGSVGPSFSVSARLTGVNVSIDVKGAGQVEYEAETIGSFTFLA